MSGNIPIEIQMDIVGRLSVKSVAQCRTVCKTWRFCIDTMHLTIRFGVRMASTFPYILIYQDRFKGCVKFIDKNLAVTIPIGSNISFSGLTPLGWSHGLWGFTFGPMSAISWGCFGTHLLKNQLEHMSLISPWVKSMKSVFWVLGFVLKISIQSF